MNKIGQIIDIISEEKTYKFSGYLKSIGIYSLDNDFTITIEDANFKVKKNCAFQLNHFFSKVSSIIIKPNSKQKVTIDYIYEYAGGNNND